MNLDAIKYVFQIPMSWFRKMDRFSKIVGGRGIVIRKDEDTAPRVEIDEQTLEQIASGGSGGVTEEEMTSAIEAAVSDLPTTDDVSTAIDNATSDFVTSDDISNAIADATSSTTTIRASYPGSQAANSSSWSRGTKGIAVTVLTRVYWSGSVLYGYYRTFTYTKKGFLASVSAETGYAIDTTVTYTGS